MSTAPIVRMANQIARAFTLHGEAEAVRRTAEHIALFWDPRLRRALDGCLDGSEGQGLSPAAAQAARTIMVGRRVHAATRRRSRWISSPASLM